MNVAQAEKAMNAAREAVSKATAVRLKIDAEMDAIMRSGGWEDVSRRVELQKALEAERAATVKHEEAVFAWQAARHQASIDKRIADRLARKKARAAGRTPDVEGARKALAARTAAVAAESERRATAKAEAAAALADAKAAAPDSSEAKRLAVVHAEAEAQLTVAGHRLADAQAAEIAARSALVEAENFGAVVDFDEAFDQVAESGDAFTASVLEVANKVLGPALANFNAALLRAHELYYRLPMELRETRSAHTAHKLGELFGSGGTNDIFLAAAHAVKG